MSKSRDILEKKARESESLKSTITNEGFELQDDDESAYQTRTELNEEGKEVLVFSDPLHSREKRSIVNYTIFNGRWEFETLDKLDENDSEKCAVKFVPTKDSSNLTIAFKSVKDRVEFMDSIYSDNEMKQIGGGMSLETFANSKVLKTTGGLIGLSVLGYGLYKMLKGKEE
jgi:hypothetical protein